MEKDPCLRHARPRSDPRDLGDWQGCAEACESGRRQLRQAQAATVNEEDPTLRRRDPRRLACGLFRRLRLVRVHGSIKKSPGETSRGKGV